MENVFSRGNSTFGLLNRKHKNSHGMCEQNINKIKIKKSFGNMFYELFVSNSLHVQSVWKLS